MIDACTAMLLSWKFGATPTSATLFLARAGVLILGAPALIGLLMFLVARPAGAHGYPTSSS
jgi:hypothetical protein